MERLTAGGTEIFVGHGLLDDTLPARADRSGCVVFTQPGAAAAAQQVAKTIDAPVYVLPDRESAKTLAEAAKAYRYLAEKDIDRQGTLVVVGGGSASDLGGFVASTYLRGIEIAVVPTTLLAAVDAAIGGKTALNLVAKNQIGTFWEPVRVTIDLDLLADLPLELTREGMAEIAKSGFVGDEQLVVELERDGIEASLEVIVPAAARVKASIVTSDLRDQGVRLHLNYGHTVGHAIEKAAGLSHGEAISVGMVAAARVAHLMSGFNAIDRHLELLHRLGLPTTCHVDRDTVSRLLSMDKKRDSIGIRMVLLEDIGEPVVAHVDAATLGAALSDTLR